MSDSLCEKCGKPPVVGCDQGVHWVDEWTVQPCFHMYVQQLKRHLGDEISQAPKIDSPLLQPSPDGGEPIVDMTKRNIYVQCGWRGFLPHLKTALTFKGPTFSFCVVNDEKIKSVFVGNEAYKNRTRDDRDDIDVYNNLADLIGDRFDLVIIKLGYLGHKNIAAAGALKEALMHRASINKPTWLLEDTDPNYAWRYAKNEEVEFYVDRFFEKIPLAPGEMAPVRTPKRSLGMVVDEELPDLFSETREEAKPQAFNLDMPGEKPSRPAYRQQQEAPNDFDISMPGEGNDRKKVWRR